MLLYEFCYAAVYDKIMEDLNLLGGATKNQPQ